MLWLPPHWLGGRGQVQKNGHRIVLENQAPEEKQILAYVTQPNSFKEIPVATPVLEVHPDNGRPWYKFLIGQAKDYSWLFNSSAAGLICLAFWQAQSDAHEERQYARAEMMRAHELAEKRAFQYEKLAEEIKAERVELRRLVDEIRFERKKQEEETRP